MKIYFILFFLLAPAAIFAQASNKILAQANQEFDKKDYVNAEANYRIATIKSGNKAVAAYNLGTTIYKQKQAAEAKKYFTQALLNANTKQEKHKAYHNLGNACMATKDYSAAVDAYKNALRNNPNDEKTRYNFALAQKMQKEEPPKTKDNKGENKDKTPQQKDSKNTDKDNNNDKSKDKDKQPDDKNNDKSNQDKDEQNKGKTNLPKPTGAKHSDLDNMLDAVNNEEQKVQEKVKGSKMKAPAKTDKDW